MYVTAPVINSRQVAEEVETCIHSLLHRQEEETEALSFGNTSLELSTGMLRCGMKHVQLSAKEFEILRLLFQSGRKNLSKETILQKVWGYDTDAVENNVEVYVGFLRKKLARTGSNVRISSIRRMGGLVSRAKVIRQRFRLQVRAVTPFLRRLFRCSAVLSPSSSS